MKNINKTNKWKEIRLRVQMKAGKLQEMKNQNKSERANITC